MGVRSEKAEERIQQDHERDMRLREIQALEMIAEALSSIAAHGIDVKVQYQGSNEVTLDTFAEDEDSETKHGLQESEILRLMENLKATDTYEDWSPEQLQERAIEILQDDIPF